MNRGETRKLCFIWTSGQSHTIRWGMAQLRCIVMHQNLRCIVMHQNLRCIERTPISTSERRCLHNIDFLRCIDVSPSPTVVMPFLGFLGYLGLSFYCMDQDNTLCKRKLLNYTYIKKKHKFDLYAHSTLGGSAIQFLVQFL